MKISGIYKIQSIIKPERYYIGSSKNILSRWKCHLYELKRNTHHSPKLQEHYNKYGNEDLVFSILIECNNIIEIEQSYLDNDFPYFNICTKANTKAGIKITEETRIKLSLSHKGQKPWNTGKHISEETKAKLSKALKGIKRGPQSEETKKRNSESSKGKNKEKWSDDRKKKHSIRMKGVNTWMVGRIPWNKK